MNQDPDNINEDILEGGPINTIDLDNEDSLENQNIFTESKKTDLVKEDDLKPIIQDDSVLDLDNVLDENQTENFIQKPEIKDESIIIENKENVLETKTPLKESSYSGHSLLSRKLDKKGGEIENLKKPETLIAEKRGISFPKTSDIANNNSLEKEIENKVSNKVSLPENKNVSNLPLKNNDPYKIDLSEDDLIMKQNIQAKPIVKETVKPEIEKLSPEILKVGGEETPETNKQTPSPTPKEDFVPASLPKKENVLETNTNKEIDVDVKPIRTYADDVKNNIQTKKITTARILIEEQKKKEALQNNYEIESPKRKGNVLRIIFTLIFIVSGTAVGYYAYQQGFFALKNTNNAVNPVLVSDIIPIEQLNSISVDLKTNTEILSEIRKIISSENSLPTKGVGKIELIKTSTESENETVIEKQIEISTDEFLTILESRTPEKLIRSFKDDFILGQVKSEKSTEPFVLFQTKDFEQVYAGMFEWEETLVSDLKDVFYKNLGSTQRFPREENNQLKEVPPTENEQDETISEETIVNEAGDTEITQETISEPTIESTYKNEFVDIILSNQDTRAILNNNGEVIFFYTIISQESIIITTNVDSLIILLNKLNSGKIVR